MSQFTQDQQAYEIALRERLEDEDDREWRLAMTDVKRYYSDDIEDRYEGKGLEPGTGQSKNSVSKNGNNPLREVRDRQLPVIRSQVQAQVHHDRRRTGNGSASLHTLPRSDRA